jgi:creatinine amidohydrolase
VEGVSVKLLLHEMSWQDAKEYFENNHVAIVPVGSNEQHGPANPLGTDHLIAKAFAEEASKKTGVVCLQVIPFGVSPHHKQFWGTISVRPKVFRKYVKEVFLSLTYYGVNKIIVVNGHGGNLAGLVEVAREMRELGVFVSVFQWWPGAEEVLPKIFSDEERHHAGAEETSVNLALHGHLVNKDRLRNEKLRTDPLKMSGFTLPFDSIDDTPSGVFGKQTTASAEKGKTVFKAVLDLLVKHVELMKKTRMEDLLLKPKV